MIRGIRFSELFTFVLFMVLTLSGHTQDCGNPQSLCPADGATDFSAQDGAPSDVGSDFCFGDAPNAVFYSFQTQNTDDFPSIDYSDSTATLIFSVDSCLVDSTVAISVFTAANLCDGTTFGSPVICEVDTNATGGTFDLESLEPSTTYFVMVTGLDEGVGASECSFSVEVSGPALEYDLDLSYFPEGDPDRTNQNIYEGETVILSAGDGFNDVEWSGPELNSLQGNEVTADPEGVDVFIPYTAIAEIDGCTFTESIEVYIAPAIQASNAFSPNGDGINDTWEIQNIDDWPNAQIFVYSRWGNKVFQTTNYSNDWGGDDLPSATYYYVIELNPIDFNAEPITGSVTIMR